MDGPLGAASGAVEAREPMERALRETALRGIETGIYSKPRGSRNRREDDKQCALTLSGGHSRHGFYKKLMLTSCNPADAAQVRKPAITDTMIHVLALFDSLRASS